MSFVKVLYFKKVVYKSRIFSLHIWKLILIKSNPQQESLSRLYSHLQFSGTKFRGCYLFPDSTSSSYFPKLKLIAPQEYSLERPLLQAVHTLCSYSRGLSTEVPYNANIKMEYLSKVALCFQVKPNLYHSPKLI